MRAALPTVTATLLGLSVGPASRAAPAGDLVVRAAGDFVTIRAEAAPLPDLLAALSRESGLRVVWGLDPPPRPLVNLTVTSQIQSEAVVAVFEGLRFNYALGLDPSGRRVKELHIVGANPPPPAVGEAAHWPAPWVPPGGRAGANVDGSRGTSRPDAAGRRAQPEDLPGAAPGHE